MNGTYSFVYSGNGGVGLGIFRITGTQLVGVDFSGVRYLGTVNPGPDGKKIRVSVDQTVPTGVPLVQGVSAQGKTTIRSFDVTWPPDFDNGQPIEVVAPPSPVTLMIRRIPDDPWAAYADGVNVDIRPISPTLPATPP